MGTALETKDRGSSDLNEREHLTHVVIAVPPPGDHPLVVRNLCCLSSSPSVTNLFASISRCTTSVRCHLDSRAGEMEVGSGASRGSYPCLQRQSEDGKPERPHLLRERERERKLRKR